MRRFFAIVILGLNLGLLSWGLAQGTRSDLFDQRKVDQELEIMKGILGTTLDFAVQDLQASSAEKTTGERRFEHPWGSSNISGFYLYGQGATFVIPTSQMALQWHRPGRIAMDLGALGIGSADYAEAMEAAQEAMQEAQEELVDVQEELRDQMQEAEEASAPAVAQPAPPPPPPPPAVAPAAPPRPATPVVRATPAPQPKPDEETIRKRLAAAQEKVKKRQEFLEQRRQKFQQALAQLKVHLIEALANHGDSLTTVKPNEYINLVLSTDMGGALFGGGSERDIISVQRSVVSDYKAGRLTLEAFKQKVLQYSN
jgi:prefoldin subunit 5